MEYRNAKFLTADGSQIDCEINHPDYGWIPFNCMRDDPYPPFDNAALFDAMAADSTTAAYVPPTAEEIAAEQAQDIRHIRYEILVNEVDKYAANALRWADLTSAQQAELSTYRQALLDITDQETFPASVTWPTKPDWV
jgi:hypothetical protein